MIYPVDSGIHLSKNPGAVNIKMYAVSKLNKQYEQTWINIQKWLDLVQFSYQKLFPNPDVYQFVKNKAVYVGSSEGYFIPSLLTTTGFILASNNAQVNITTHKQPPNIFTIFVGYPGTGKFNCNLFYIQIYFSWYLALGTLICFPHLHLLSVQSKTNRASID